MEELNNMQEPQVEQPSNETVVDVLNSGNPIEQKVQHELSPEVQAAMYIRQALPIFRAQVEKLTGVQAKRVLCKLVESPLEEETPAFTTEEAHKLFMLGTQIQNAKFILFQVAINDQKIASEVETQAAVAGAGESQEAASTETNNEVKEETNA